MITAKSEDRINSLSTMYRNRESGSLWLTTDPAGNTYVCIYTAGIKPHTMHVGDTMRYTHGLDWEPVSKITLVDE